MESSHEIFNTEMHLSISGLDSNKGYVFLFLFSVTVSLRLLLTHRLRHLVARHMMYCL